MTSTAPQPSETELLLLLEREKLHAEYKDYFKRKRTNFFATLQAFPALWECFLRSFMSLLHLHLGLAISGPRLGRGQAF